MNITRQPRQKFKQLVSRLISLKKSKFTRNVTIVASGTAAAQAISMAFSPVITRLYGAEAFGVLGVFLAMISIMIPIASLSYTTAIVLPPKDNDSFGLLKLATMIALCLSIIVTVILLMFKEPVVKLFRIEAIAPYILLIPLVMFLAACEQGFTQWLFRKNKFKITAKIAIIQAITVGITKSGLGVFWPTARILVFLTTLGHALNTTLLAISTKNILPTKGNEEVTENRNALRYYKELALKYHDFPLYRAPQTFLNAISQSLPVILLSSLFGPSAAGFYAIGNRVMGMPISLVGQSVANVFYPRIASAAQSKENIQSMIIRATLGLGAIAFIPFATVFVFGPQLFGFVFGHDWIMAGEYARWMGVWLFFLLINRPSINAIPVLDMQKELLLFEIFTITSRIVAIMAGFYLFNSDLAAVILYSLLGAFLNILIIAYVILMSSRVTSR